MTEARYSVLLVDDSDDDRLFIRRVIVKSPAFYIVAELTDGDAAIAYLSGDGNFADRTKHPIPDVVLLDLKLPKKTGHEVLEWLQGQPIAGKMKVIVLSGSFLPEDITRSRQLGAHGYFKKEAFEDEQQAIINEMEKIVKGTVQAPG